MAALQPSSEGQPLPSAPLPQKSFSQLFTIPQPSPIALKKPSLYKAKPAIFFSQEDISKLAAPFSLSLVGKFSHGRPRIDDIRKFFLSLDLKDSVTVGHLDARHVLLRFKAEPDFHRIWTKGIWQLGKFPMRTFRWTPNFHIHKESSLAPVWFSLPALPIHFFDKISLFSIVSAFGRPMFVDHATATFSRPSVARVCVEVDLLQNLPDNIWIGIAGESSGFWQPIQAENLPKYCSACWHVGHSKEDCRKESFLGADVVPKDKNSAKQVIISEPKQPLENTRIKSVYIPVQKQPVTNVVFQKGESSGLNKDSLPFQPEKQPEQLVNINHGLVSDIDIQHPRVEDSEVITEQPNPIVQQPLAAGIQHHTHLPPLEMPTEPHQIDLQQSKLIIDISSEPILVDALLDQNNVNQNSDAIDEELVVEDFPSEAGNLSPRYTSRSTTRQLRLLSRNLDSQTDKEQWQQPKSSKARGTRARTHSDSDLQSQPKNSDNSFQHLAND